MNQEWEAIFINYCQQKAHLQDDASHDLHHFMRVARTAHDIASCELSSVDSLVLLAAAYFHDIVFLPKDHPEAHLSSRLAAEKALEILIELQFPQPKLQAVYHAIHAHSFSAKVEPQTLEAQIIQDADRLEALGALGVLRTFYLSSKLNSQPYHPQDPFATQRSLDDKRFALDHFYCKLFHLPSLLKTAGGRRLAAQRVEFLQQFIHEITRDIAQDQGGAYWLAWACHRAGSRRLFDAQDPFAIHRTRQPDCFIVDQCLGEIERFPFLRIFLDQLKEEVGVETTAPI